MGAGKHRAVLEQQRFKAACLSGPLLPSEGNWAHHLQAHCSLSQITALAGRALLATSCSFLERVTRFAHLGSDARPPKQSVTFQQFEDECFQNSNVFKGSPSTEPFWVLLVLRIITKTHGLSLSRQNGTVPDRKVSAGQTAHAPRCPGVSEQNRKTTAGPAG